MSRCTGDTSCCANTCTHQLASWGRSGQACALDQPRSASGWPRGQERAGHWARSVRPSGPVPGPPGAPGGGAASRPRAPEGLHARAALQHLAMSPAVTPPMPPSTAPSRTTACPRKRRLVSCCAMVKPVRPDGRASKIRLRKPIRDPGCEARKPPAAYWPRAAQSSSARPPRPAPPAQPPHHPRARRPPHRRTRPQRVDHGLRSHCRRLRLRPPVSQAAKTAGSEGRKRALAMACSVLANSCGPKVPDGQQGRLLEVVRPRPRPHPS